MRDRDRLITALKSVNLHAPGVGWMADVLHDAAQLLETGTVGHPKDFQRVLEGLAAGNISYASPHLCELAQQALHYLKAEGRVS